MNRSLKLLLSAAALAALSLARPAAAQSASSDITITANVQGNCRVTNAGNITVAYDPTSATDATGSSSLNVRCTKGVTYSVGAGNGATRSVAGTTPATETLSYDLYATGTTPWDVNLYATEAGNRAPGVDYPVNVVIPAGQDVTAGNVFTETVTFTVNW